MLHQSFSVSNLVIWEIELIWLKVWMTQRRRRNLAQTPRPNNSTARLESVIWVAGHWCGNCWERHNCERMSITSVARFLGNNCTFVESDTTVLFKQLEQHWRDARCFLVNCKCAEGVIHQIGKPQMRPLAYCKKQISSITEWYKNFNHKLLQSLSSTM